MTTVLMTGAGGAAAPFMIDRLRKTGSRVLAADMDQHAIGLYLADLGFVVPAGSSPDFLRVLRSICISEKVDVLVPLVDEELIAALEIEKEGIIVILPKQEFVAICLDKLLLMQRLRAAGIYAPVTRLASTGLDEMRFPMVVKPRTGRGSRGVGIVSTEDELTTFLNATSYARNELIFQEYITGPEFTVSVVVWRDGEVKDVVPKEIISKKGITHMAVTRRNHEIEKLCCKIQEHFRADGPFNVQLCIDEKSGKPYPFEINPRFSTTISLTIAAGVDELGGLIALAVEGKEGAHFGGWKEGVVLLRKITDQFVDEKEFLEHPIIMENN